MNNMDYREVLKYILLAWGISGVIIAFVTWVLMLKRGTFKEIDWSDVIDALYGFVIITVLSYIWVALNVHWYYDDKKRMKKIKEGKTSAKDLF